MINVMVSIFPPSASLTYVAIYHRHLLMGCVSQLIRYARACSTYEQFIKRVMLLTNTFLEHEHHEPRSKASFRKVYG